MGSTTISYAVIAVAVGLACLLAGFLWGRSNLKSRVEQAVEEGAVSLDAREFAMRQQLDEAIGEVARLRPLAEELGRVQDRLKLEQSKYEGMKADFDATLRGGAGEEEIEPEIPLPAPEPPAPQESADEAIQRLLQSLETLSPNDVPLDVEKIEPAVPEVLEGVPAAKPVAIADQRHPIAPQSSPEPPKSSPEPPRLNEIRPTSQSTPQPVPSEAKAPVSLPQPRPVPGETKAPIPSPQPKPGETVDEWQEFARSLAALTGRKQ